MHAKPGDAVTEGAPLMTLHTDEPERFERALEALDGAFDIDAEPGSGPDAIGQHRARPDWLGWMPCVC